MALVSISLTQMPVRVVFYFYDDDIIMEEHSYDFYVEPDEPMVWQPVWGGHMTQKEFWKEFRRLRKAGWEIQADCDAPWRRLYQLDDGIDEDDIPF